MWYCNNICNVLKYQPVSTQRICIRCKGLLWKAVGYQLTRRGAERENCSNEWRSTGSIKMCTARVSQDNRGNLKQKKIRRMPCNGYELMGRRLKGGYLRQPVELLGRDWSEPVQIDSEPRKSRVFAFDFPLDYLWMHVRLEADAMCLRAKASKYYSLQVLDLCAHWCCTVHLHNVLQVQ